MNIRILGPLEIRDRDDREIRVPAGRERALLALLLVHRGEVVSTDRIVDTLWGEHPPGTAAKAVQGYVSHLRRLLEPVGVANLLLTRPPGYALRLDGVTVDAPRFERLAADGRRALEDGATTEAVGLLDEALVLWRGPALTGVRVRRLRTGGDPTSRGASPRGERGPDRVAAPARASRRRRRRARQARRRPPTPGAVARTGHAGALSQPR